MITNQLKTIQGIAKDVHAEIEQFHKEVKRGAALGITKMASAFPRAIDAEIAAMDGGNAEARRFIISNFLRFFQPNIQVGDSSPVMQTFLDDIKRKLHIFVMIKIISA